MTTDRDLDPDRLGRYTLATWGFKQGEVVSLMIHLGHRLGLYEALDGAGPVTASELAAATGYHERWLLEWLRGQAAARLLVSDDGEVFELEAEAAEVLARSGSRSFAAGAFAVLRPAAVVDGIAESFTTGRGLDYDGLGEDSAQHVEGMLGPMTRALLLPVVIPGLDGVADKLAAGGTVIDVGCGGGLVIEMLADAFPASRFVGYDPSERAIEMASERLVGRDNVELHTKGGEELPPSAAADLVGTCDWLPHMPRPDLTMQAIRGAISDDGTWVIKDIRSSPHWSDNLKNPMLAMMYGTSVGSCLQSAMSADDALGLGTLGLNPEVARSMTAEAGFGRFSRLEVDDPTNLYYEVRP